MATTGAIIVEVARKNRHRQFVIDGEAGLLTFDGISDFDALHSRRHNELVQFYAFDILSRDREDLRDLALSVRKTYLARHPDGIFVAPFEQGEIGPDLFIAACDMGLEGMQQATRSSACTPARAISQAEGTWHVVQGTGNFEGMTTEAN